MLMISVFSNDEHALDPVAELKEYLCFSIGNVPTRLIRKFKMWMEVVILVLNCQELKIFGDLRPEYWCDFVVFHFLGKMSNFSDWLRISI